MLAAIRKAKSTAKVSMRAEVARVVVQAPTDVLDKIGLVSEDIKSVGHVAEIVLRANDDAELTVDVELS